MNIALNNIGNMKNNGLMDFSLGGNAISMSSNKLNESERLQATKSFNEATNKATEAFKKNIDKELEASRKLKEETKNLEIYPTNGNILVRMDGKNPWEQIKMTDSGLILPVYDGSYKSHETGEEETKDMIIAFAEVIEVGPEVKYVKQGDDIIFRNHTQLPAPFLGQSLWIVSQNNVLVVINESLSERFKIKK